MNLRKWFQMTGVAAAAAVVLTACGGGDGGNGGGGGNTLAVGSDGENLAYDQTALSASAGQVQITFRNNSAAQQHNLVVVRGGDAEAQAVNDAGVAAGPPDYVAEGTPNLIGHTAMLNGGAEETITVNLEPGSYKYICTFPGHYPAMQGTLTVQ